MKRRKRIQSYYEQRTERAEIENDTKEADIVYIRNAIDHPDSGNIYTKEELRTSIEFLIELCKENDT